MLRCVAIKIAVCIDERASLTSESVQGTSLSFQSVDNVHSGDSLSLGVLSVSDCITDNIFQENLEDTSGFFINQS